MNDSTLPIGATGVLLAAALIIANAGLSLALSLNLERSILMAAVRSLVQLTLIGYVLVPIFAWRSPWMIGLVALAMILMASRESVGRVKRTYPGIFRRAFLGVSTSALVVGLYGLLFVIGARPWYEPRYLVPLLGMLLGNTLTGVSLGLDRFLEIADEERDRIEGLLAVGATPWQSSRFAVQRSLSAGMTPILNTMPVVGLVSLPGMMTGQILAGNNPALASRYQIVILFMISSTTALGMMIAVGLAYRSMFDDEARLVVLGPGRGGSE